MKAFAVTVMLVAASMFSMSVQADHRTVHDADPDQMDVTAIVAQYSGRFEYRAGWYDADETKGEEDANDCFADRRSQFSYTRDTTGNDIYIDLGAYSTEQYPTGLPATDDPLSDTPVGQDCAPEAVAEKMPEQEIGMSDTTAHHAWFLTDVYTDTNGFTSDSYWLVDSTRDYTMTVFACPADDDNVDFQENGGTIFADATGMAGSSSAIIFNDGHDCRGYDGTDFMRLWNGNRDVEMGVRDIDLYDIMDLHGRDQSVLVVTCISLPVQWKGVPEDSARFTSHDWFHLIAAPGGNVDTEALEWSAQPHHGSSARGDNGCPGSYAGEGVPAGPPVNWATEVSDYCQFYADDPAAEPGCVPEEHQ